MRLQLKAACLLAALAWAAPARAGTEASERVTIFSEPSKDGKGVVVYHPQTNVSAAIGSVLNLNAGYDVDIVSGASRRQFGLRSGVDAVSAATEFSDTRHQVKGGFSFDRPTSGI